MHRRMQRRWRDDKMRHQEKIQRSQQQQMIMLKIIFVMLLVTMSLRFVMWIIPEQTAEKTEIPFEKRRSCQYHNYKSHPPYTRYPVDFVEVIVRLNGNPIIQRLSQ